MSRAERIDLTPAQRRRFHSAVRSLNELIEDVRRTVPHAQYYLDADSNLNLMSGPSHEGPGAEARPDRIIDHARLHHSGGGDW